MTINEIVVFSALIIAVIAVIIFWMKVLDKLFK